MRWLKIAIAAVVVAAALVIFFGVPANFVAGTVKSRIEAQTGYRLQLGGETTLSFWPQPTISLRDVTLSTADAGGEDRFKAERVAVALSLRDLWHGHARITEMTVSRPTLRLPLPRERVAPAPASAAAGGGDANPQSVTIDRIFVKDGTVKFYGQSGGDEGQIERVNFEVSHAPAAAGASVTGSVYIGSQIVDVDMTMRVLPQRLEQQAIPVQITLRAPGMFRDPLALSAELRARNGVVAINTLSGRFGENRFDGFATVDFGAGKPVVRADLDFTRLQFAAVPSGEAGAQQPTALSEPWSNRQYSFDVLNFFDAQMRLAAADFSVASFHVAPVGVEATINGGVLQAKLMNTALYGGTADGSFALDASRATPAHALNLRLAGVAALPLLTDVVAFDSLDGAMAANIDVHATGASEQAAMSNLTGAVDVHLSNGAVRGIDLVKIMHNLVDTVLNGWQWNANDRTPLTDLTAHFGLANGVATTDNLALAGPVVQMTGAGTINIAAKTLQMRVEPRLVVGQQDTANAGGSPGAAGSAQGSGLGVPVLIQGSWSEPRISPDVSGILNNPGAMLDQLQAAGKGLLGGGQSGANSANGGSANGGNNTFDNLLGGIGNMLKGSPGGGFLGNGR